MLRALQGKTPRDALARLVTEQIHGVACMVPQQMVGPAPRLAERVVLVRLKK